MLPGGDLLAAALAAGETPSPQLVAASGEEGTLPRRHAWLWLAGCVVSLAFLVPLAAAWQLPGMAPIELQPDQMVLKAREVLAGLG